MTVYSSNSNEFIRTCRWSIVAGLVFAAGALSVAFFLPAKKNTEKQTVTVLNKIKTETEENVDSGSFFEDVGYQPVNSHEDEGLSLYRQSSSRAAVEWFYLHVSGDRNIAMAILESADKNDIPLPLAFALAYTESHYNVEAVNRNKNKSIDRGLFQLNSASFPNLTELDFFDPAISAKYGLSHLRFCLTVAGNEIPALAMYNAGTGKVRADNTPQITLNYIGKIMGYQETIEKLFNDEVLAYYDTRPIDTGVSVAYLKK
jgi:hypothetical protein